MLFFNICMREGCAIIAAPLDYLTKEFSIRFARLSFSLKISKIASREKRRIHLCAFSLALDVLLFTRILSDDENDDGALAAVKIASFLTNSCSLVPQKLSQK